MPCRRWLLPRARAAKAVSETDASRRPATPSRTRRWDEHYRDERDAAFLYRALAAAEQEAERARSLRAARGRRGPSRRSAGRSCFVKAAGRCPPTGPRARTRALAWVGAPIRTGRHPAADARRGRSRGAGLSRPGAALEQSADARRRWTSPRTPRSTRASCRRSWAAKGEPWHVGGAGGYPAQRRLRLQRRPDRELRPGRRRDRRRRRAAHRDHQRRRRGDRGRAVDGRERLPRREERGGGPGAPDRHGAPRDAADAGSRGGRARGDLRGEGAAARDRARDGARDDAGSRRRRSMRWCARS